MTYYQLLMSPDKELGIKTLNNVAVNYFELGLCDLSYQIWTNYIMESRAAWKTTAVCCLS